MIGVHGPLCVAEKQNQKSLQRERSFLEMCLDAWNPKSLRGALVMLELRVRKPADCKTRQKLLPDNCIKTLNRIQAADLLCRTPDCTRKIEEPQRLLRSQHLPICHKGRLNQFNSTLPSETAAGATSTPSRSQSWQVDRKKGIQTDPNSTRTSEQNFGKLPNLRNGPKLA